MARLTFILSIWVLVDKTFGTQDSIGAAAHTVRSISKVNTLDTGIRALGKKDNREIGAKVNFRSSSETQTQASGCFHLQLQQCPASPSPTHSSTEMLVLLLYRAIACGSALHELAFWVA